MPTIEAEKTFIKYKKLVSYIVEEKNSLVSFIHQKIKSLSKEIKDYIEYYEFDSVIEDIRDHIIHCDTFQNVIDSDNIFYEIECEDSRDAEFVSLRTIKCIDCDDVFYEIDCEARSDIDYGEISLIIDSKSDLDEVDYQ